jgi:hypothetical protein
LKQARHRASRLFLNEGARSSLPQYLQTSFSALDTARDDCADRRAAFLVFERSASFGLAATSLVFVITLISFSGRRFGATDRPQESLLCRGDMGSDPAERADAPSKIARG